MQAPGAGGMSVTEVAQEIKMLEEAELT